MRKYICGIERRNYILVVYGADGWEEEAGQIYLLST
jgi:hypothetical protein